MRTYIFDLLLWGNFLVQRVLQSGFGVTELLNASFKPVATSLPPLPHIPSPALLPFLLRFVALLTFGGGTCFLDGYQDMSHRPYKQQDTGELNMPAMTFAIILYFLGVVAPLQAAKFHCSSGDVTCLIAAINTAMERLDSTPLTLSRDLHPSDTG